MVRSVNTPARDLPERGTPAGKPASRGTRPTQADVARLAGVSTATVSHVLSGRRDRKGSGDPRTRARVEAAARELAYQPDWVASALRRGRTGIVAVLGTVPSTPWSERIIARAQGVLSENGLDAVVIPQVDDQTSDRFASLLERGAADAALVLDFDLLDDDRRARLVGSGVPIVGFGERPCDGALVVRHGYARAQRDMVLALRERGVRRFCIASDRDGLGPDDDPQFLGAIEAALSRDDIGPPPRIQHVVIERRTLPDRRALERIDVDGATAEDPLVVVAISDHLALQVVDHLERAGALLGRDVGVVGRGDIAEAAAHPAGISTFGATLEEYERALRLLAESTGDGEERTEAVTLDWHFIERATTAGLRPIAVSG